MVGIHNYYRFTNNAYILNRVSYILLYSCAKTIVLTKKITMPQGVEKKGFCLQIQATQRLT